MSRSAPRVAPRGTGWVAFVLAAAWVVAQGVRIEGVLPPGPSLELLAARLGIGGQPLAQFPLWQVATAPLLLLPAAWWPAAFQWFSVACGAASGALLLIELARLHHDRTVVECDRARRQGGPWGGRRALMVAAGVAALWLLSEPLWGRAHGVSAEPFHALVLVALVHLGRQAAGAEGPWRWRAFAFLLGAMLAEYALAWLALPAAALWILRARLKHLNDVAFWRDVGMTFAAGLSAWFWLPLFYSSSAIAPDSFRTVFTGLLIQNALYVRAALQALTFFVWVSLLLPCFLPLVLVCIRWRDTADRALVHEVVERAGFAGCAIAAAVFLVERVPFGIGTLAGLPCPALLHLVMALTLAYLLGYWCIQLDCWFARGAQGAPSAIVAAIAAGLPLFSLARIAAEPPAPSTAAVRALLRLTRESVPPGEPAVLLCEPTWWGQALAVNAPGDWPASRFRLVTERELLRRGGDPATWAAREPRFFRPVPAHLKAAPDTGDWALAMAPGTALYATGELPPAMRRTCLSAASGLLLRAAPRERTAVEPLPVAEPSSFWNEAGPWLATAAREAAPSDPACVALARSLNLSLASSRQPDAARAGRGAPLRRSNPSLALNLRLLHPETRRKALGDAEALAAALEREALPGWNVASWHDAFGPVLSAAHFRSLAARWMRQGYFAAAGWALVRASVLDPEDRRVAFLRAELAFREERPRDAFLEAESLLTNGPTLPARVVARLHQVAGLAAQKLGRLEIADAHLAKAAEADSRLPGLGFQTALLRVLQRRWDDAAARFQSVLTETPGRPDALLGLGLAEACRGRHEAARTAWSQAFASAPGDPRAPLLLAWLEAREGHLAQAESRLLEAVSRGRDSPALQELLAAVRTAKAEGNRTGKPPASRAIGAEPPFVPFETVPEPVAP